MSQKKRRIVKSNKKYRVIEISEDYYGRDYEQRGPFNYVGTSYKLVVNFGKYEISLGSYGYYGLDTKEQVYRRLRKPSIQKQIKSVLSNENHEINKMRKEIKEKEIKLQKLLKSQIEFKKDIRKAGFKV